MPGEEFDPLSTEGATRMVVDALMRAELRPLGELPRFWGAGVYLLFYSGDFACYQRISGKMAPIYVGKAIPPGGRKGWEEEDPDEALWKRLCEHARSIDQTQNLQLAHFGCKYLAVKPIWIGGAERLLLRNYRPIWNGVIDGFGNHDPGSGRYNQERSPWDGLHPGRDWAMRLRDRSELAEAIAQRAATFLEATERERPELFV